MIGLYADRIIRTDLPLLAPVCRAPRPNVIPYVDGGLPCLMEALSTAHIAVALRTDNKLLVKLARELRPDLLILVEGIRIRAGRIRPLLRPGDGGRGYYVVEERNELSELREEDVEGLFLRAESFPWAEYISSGALKCPGCDRCSPLRLLLCEPYRELEVL